MSEDHLRPTVASDIALPVEIVTLQQLKTKSGEPVLVLCEAVDELVATERSGLPGARVMPEGNSPIPGRARVEEILASAYAIVHSGTALVREDGSEVRPAFHCDDAHAVSGSIPWRLVAVPDKLRVVSTCLRLSGYGGAVDERFSGGHEGGDVHGVGAVASVEGNGQVATSGAAGS